MYSLKINSFEGSEIPLTLGRRGENNVRYIYYDMSQVIDELGDGTFEFFHKPFSYGASYPMLHTFRAGDYACATLTSVDMKYDGPGELQLVFYPNDTTTEEESANNYRTFLFKTYIERSLDGSADAPDPWDQYAELMRGYKEEAEKHANYVKNMTVSAESVPAGTQPEVIKTLGEDTMNLLFKIPKSDLIGIASIEYVAGVGLRFNLADGTHIDASLPFGFDSNGFYYGS